MRAMDQDTCIAQHVEFSRPIHESELCGISGGNGESRSCAVS